MHVGCPYTGRGVCFCLHGTPASLRAPGAAAKYNEQAREAWEFWQNPGKALGHEDTVEVLLPRLVKVEKLVRKPTSHAIEHGLPTRKEAEQAVQAAAKIAEQSALRASKLAAAAGQDYVAPEGLGVELPPVEKVDHSELEAAVTAVAANRRKAAAQAELAQQRAAAAAGGHSGSEATAPTSMVSKGGTSARSGGTAGQLQPEGRSSSRQAARAAAAAAAAAAAGAPHVVSPADLVQPPKLLRVKVKPSSPNPAPPAKAPKSAGPAAARGPAGIQVDMGAFPPGYELRGPSTKHPPKNWFLKMKDYKPSLQGEMVQLFWPDDGQWWPAMVISVTGSSAERKVSLYYETGDEETTDLTPLIKAGEVAWLFGPGGAKGRVSALDDVRSAPQPAAAAGTKRQRSHAAALAAAGSDTEDEGLDDLDDLEEDEEDRIMARLRHVTKRQNAAAAPSRRSAAAAGAAAAASTGSGGVLELPRRGQRGRGAGAEEQQAQSQAQAGGFGGLGDGPNLLGGGGMGASAQAQVAGGMGQGGLFPPPAPNPGPSAMRELLAMGPAAVGRTVQLRLGSIQQPFYGVVADVLPQLQQVRVQLGGRYAALDMRDEGVKFLVHLLAE